MNPVLRKLSNPRLSAIRAADLIEKHIGAGANAYHCVEVIAALKRLRDPEQGPVARVLARLIVADSKDPCLAVREVIDYLRGIAPSSSGESV